MSSTKSPYAEPAAVLNLLLSKKNASLKSIIYSKRVNNKAKTYALVAETLKHKTLLDEILKESNLSAEKLAKNQGLLYVLLYDQLLGKGIKGGGVVKRKIHDNLELLQKAFSLLHKPTELTDRPNTMRYARVNTAKSNISDVLEGLDAFSAKAEVDKHIPYLLNISLPKKQSSLFHRSNLVKDGEVVLQEKSSCFPAHILFTHAQALLENKSFDFVDATAAPGNKTTQLGSLIIANKFNSKLFAFDKDRKRFGILERRSAQLLPNKWASDNLVLLNEDFLKSDPSNEKYSNVKAIMVDPSCSGSGIASRIENATKNDSNEKVDDKRLDSLSQFQKTCVLHAMKFPNVQLVSYSTCSIHFQENEKVVENVLQENPNFLLEKIEFKTSKWNRRGRSFEGCKLSKKQLSCLLRADREQDGTTGFFVALFRKTQNPKNVAKAPNSISSKISKKKKKRRGRGRQLVVSKKAKIF